MSKYYKYNRTYHLEWSPGLQNDDRRQINYEEFKKPCGIVALLKMDGDIDVGSPASCYKWTTKYIESLSEPKIYDVEVEINECYVKILKLLL